MIILYMQELSDYCILLFQNILIVILFGKKLSLFENAIALKSRTYTEKNVEMVLIRSARFTGLAR